MIEPYYKQDGITIYNADCRDVLPQLETFDLLLTDPPYGIGYDKSAFKASGKKSKLGAAFKTSFKKSSWDSKPVEDLLLNQAIESALYSIVWGGNYFIVKPSRCWLFWDKMNDGKTFADGELAWINLNKSVRRFQFLWDGMLQKNMKNKENRVHPTQKPLPLMQWCIKQAGDGVNTIFDPFMGSGTTLVAAKLEGKQAVGIELDESYCESAAKRLEQGVLFAAEV